VSPEGSARTEFGAEGDRLTHTDGLGKARMVDVTGKPWTRRRAVARCRVLIGEPTMIRLCENPSLEMPTSSGTLADVLATARIAGIQAAKDTAGLVPLCHSLSLSGIEVRLSLLSDGIGIEGEATTTGPTGVEMEALTACAFAALSAVSALRAAQPEISIEELSLWEKSGGRSGSWERRPSS
jgi:molybdenum cofactor biosynthesis protein MoaC